MRWGEWVLVLVTTSACQWVASYDRAQVTPQADASQRDGAFVDAADGGSTDGASPPSDGESVDVATIDAQVALFTQCSANNWCGLENPPTLWTLNAVWGMSPTDVYMVGEAGTVLHFDGSRIAPMPSAPGGRLLGIWGSSATNIYIVGWGGIASHYDGTAWSDLDVGNVTAALTGIWGSGLDDIYISGQSGVLLRYTATDGWVDIGAGTLAYGTNLLAVHGTGPSRVWAVGTVSSVGTIYMIDNGAISSQLVGGYHRGVWAVGDEAFVASSTGTGTPDVRYFDGTTWSGSKCPGGSGGLNAVWGFSNTDVYYVGERGTICRNLAVMQSGTSVTLNGVWGADGVLFAVGDSGTILRRGP